MLSKMQKSAFVIVAGIVAMLICGPHPSLAAQDGAGFWTYLANRYIALVNLTDYPLTYVRSNEPGAFPYPDIWNDLAWETHSVFEAGTDWKIEPFRTKVWYSSSEGYTAYDGRITLYSEGFPEWKFDVVFKGQHAASGLLHSGTWTALSPAYHGAFSQVSASEAFSCAISETKYKQVFCWGDNVAVPATPPAGIFKQVSTGYWHACGIKQDDTAFCWGDNDGGRMDAPENELFSQVSAGGWHTCGVKRDGHVVCWGSNSGGRATPPDGQFRQISSSKWHNCGVKTDGHVVCWGDNSGGRMNAPANDLFSQVSTGPWHSCGVRTNGTVTCWGSDEAGQATPPDDAAIPGTYQQVSAGGWHTCGLKTDGTVSCWGTDDDSRKSSTPKGTFKQIDAGERHTCAVSTDGQISCWGNNGAGQRALPLASLVVDGGWAPANTKAYGRWATPVNDNKMHNVMTLISPDIMVTLYSGDNVNATIVVQQLNAWDDQGTILWDDAAAGTYQGNQLDFVDNASTSVPGQ